MGRIDRMFTGGLNLDDDPYRLPAGDYSDSLNIVTDAQGTGQDGVISNLNGNQKVVYTLPAGSNKCIGGYPDKVRSRYYYFIYNTNGNHSILYFSSLTTTITKLLESKTDSSGIDILNFNPSYLVLSINVINIDSTGDLLFFNDGYNPPRKINVTTSYGTAWKAEYLDLIKSPPQMPPKCTYENDTTIGVNNVRNAAFQFRYRFEYADNNKSVWGSAGIVPLPFQPSSNLTQDTFTNNSRISVSMSTGNVEVKKIELAVRITKNGTTPVDWLFIKSYNKTDLSISDNDIYTIKFYNDGIYTPIDVKDTTELQDYVPQLADAGELLNGNTPIYGSITEGYDPVTVSLSVTAQAFSASSYFYDFQGLLYFATISGVDSGTQGTTVKIYLYGTGTNTAGAVTTLNNGYAHYVLNVLNGSGANVGTDYLNASDTPTVASVLAGVSAALVINGFTQVSLVGNILTMSYPTTLTILSSGIKTGNNAFPANETTTRFTYPWQSAYTLALMYFDSKGRTNGAFISAGSAFTLPVDNGGNMTPQLSIASRPPTWASYYQVLRSTNLTYNKLFYWITNGAYSDTYANILGIRYAYLEIDNINQYNQQIQATDNVVGYEFTPGDRVRIYGRYDAVGTAAAIGSVFDYEILGTEASINVGGLIRSGNFLKINWPSADVTANFKFDGTPNFLTYALVIYNYAAHSSDKEQPYFEFGKCFGIGNIGTTSAYHIGLEQTQTFDLVTPALVSIANGDFFARKRVIPVGQTFIIAAQGSANNDIYAAPTTTVTGTTNANYTVQASTGILSNSLTPGDYTSASNFFLNLSANPITIRLRGSIPISAGGFTGAAVLFQAVNSDTTYELTTLIPPVSLNANNSYNIVFDGYVTVKALARGHLVIQNTTKVANEDISDFYITLDVINNVTDNIIENSFSDTYTIITNSDGRASVVEQNVSRQKYPTLVRFGGSYLVDSTINNVNRFREEDLDEYNRSFGKIQRLHVRGSYMKVYQQFKVGDVPVLIQIVQDTTGNPLQAESNKLINNIHYYQEDFGIGFSPASLAWNNFADYFVDDVRGAVCRLSQDGIQPLSILYKTNAFFSERLKYFRTELNNGIVPAGQTYMGNPTVLGVFDAYNNRYILALEVINRYSNPSTLVFHQDAYTISFNERKNRFDSPYSYKPEFMGVLNNTLVSMNNGEFWTHDSATYCNFYGVQYACFVTLVFNDLVLLKKSFQSLVETGNVVWVAPSITTSMNSYGTTKQSSNLVSSDFQTLEGTFNAAFLRDSNSIGGIVNGEVLKGEFIVIKLQVDSANTAVLVELNSATVKYLESAFNVR